MIVIAEFEPLDPVGGTRTTLRATNADDARVTGLNSVRWWPALSDAPVINIRLFKGDFDGQIEAGQASVTLRADALVKLNANARRFLWAGAPVRFYAGNAGDAWPWTQVFEGLVERFEAQGNSIKVTARIDTEPFQKDVLPTKYAGTGGAEGGADLKNKPKPFLLGRCLNVEPVQINATDSVYQFSGYGQIQAVNALYERGSSFGASVGDFGSYALLVAATIPAGRWGTCLAEGMIRLGAPAYGVITGDVDGDKQGGTWRRKTGEIIQRIASNAGVSGTVIDATSFNALDTALAGLSNQGRIGIYITDQENVLDLAARLAAPCNAQVGISLTGKLFAMRVSTSSPTLTLDAQARQMPAVLSSVESDVSPPYSLIEFGWGRSWRVHSFSEISFYAELIERGAYSGSETYREGNIVQDQGASWVYINPTATAGNAPPTLPTTSNAYWRVLANAGVDGDPGVNAKAIFVTSDRQIVNVDTLGAVSPSTGQDITFKLNKQNLSTATVKVSLFQADGFQVNAWSYVNLIDGSGTDNGDNTFNFTGSSLGLIASYFNTARGATKGIRLKVQHVADGVSDEISINISQQGSAGANGTNGDDGLTIAASKPILTVARSAAGIVKSGELPKSTQMTVYDGTTDVTATATYAVSATGCSVSNDGGGAFTLTAVTTETAYFDVTATYGSKSIVQRIPTAQPKDGSAASRAVASVTSMNASSTYTAIAQVDIVAAAGATITGNASCNYNAAFFSGSGTQAVRQQALVSIENLTDSGSPVDGTAVIGSAATYIGGDGPGDTGSVSASQAITNSTGSPKTFRLKFMIRKYDGLADADTAGGTYSGSIEAQVA